MALKKALPDRNLVLKKALPDGNWALKYHYQTGIWLSNIITGHEFACQYLSIWKGLGGSGRTLKAQGGSRMSRRVWEGP